MQLVIHTQISNINSRWRLENFIIRKSRNCELRFFLCTSACLNVSMTELLCDCGTALTLQRGMNESKQSWYIPDSLQNSSLFDGCWAWVEDLNPVSNRAASTSKETSETDTFISEVKEWLRWWGQLSYSYGCPFTTDWSMPWPSMDVRGSAIFGSRPSLWKAPSSQSPREQSEGNSLRGTCAGISSITAQLSFLLLTVTGNNIL